MKTKVLVQKTISLTNKQIAELLKFPPKTYVKEENKFEDGDRVQTGLIFTWHEEEEREI